MTPHTALIPTARRHRLAVSLGLALCALSAAAQDAGNEDSGTGKAKALDQVIVTGTRVSDRTVAESLSPIDVLSVETLDVRGSIELIQSLARTVPSFNFPNTSITDGSDHVRPAQLRGLAPDQTLVLVNGKRRHNTAIVNVNGSLGRGSSPVDLNAIPSSAIERIEVLRDGAAAQYGSDAIAGVINIVLKGAHSGSGADYRYGKFDTRNDGELNDISGYTGFDFGQGGYFTVAAEYRDRGATNRSRPDPRQQFPLVNGQPDPREATFNRLNHRFGDAAVEDQLLFVNGLVPLGDSIEVYSFANVSQRQGNSAGFYRRALDSRNVPAIHPNGFLPLILSDSDDVSVFGGVRGALGAGWNFDLSVGFGGNEFDFNVGNSVNTSLGVNSPTEFFAGTLENGQTTVNLDLDRAFDVGLAYPLNVAVGLEYRRDTYQIHPGEEASFVGSGSQVFPGFRPGDATDEARHNWSGYIEFDADFSDRFSGSFAARYEDYSDFGSTVSGKLSARYAFTDALALRGTISNGFRAPSLSQQFYSTTATNFINGVPFDVRTFPVTSPVAQALGAEPLDAEESTNFSLGLVAHAGDWSITADAYHIKVRDRIVLSGNLTGDAVRDFLASRGFDNANGGRYFTNAVDTTTEGIDVVGSTAFDLGAAGALDLTLALNYNQTDLDRIAPNPAVLEAVDLTLQRIDHVEIGRITKGTPKYKGIASLDWNRGPWSARLGITYYGTYWVFDSNPAEDQKFGAEWVFDAALTYRLSEHLSLTAGIDNFTDELPEEVIPANSFNGILPFSGGNTPFGFNGRFFWGRASLRF